MDRNLVAGKRKNKPSQFATLLLISWKKANIRRTEWLETACDALSKASANHQTIAEKLLHKGCQLILRMRLACERCTMCFCWAHGTIGCCGVLGGSARFRSDGFQCDSTSWLSPFPISGRIQDICIDACLLPDSQVYESSQ